MGTSTTSTTTQTKTYFLSREALTITAGGLVFAALLIAVISGGLRGSIQRLPEDLRLDLLLTAPWCILATGLLGLLIGLLVGVLYARGYRTGHQHSAQIYAAPRPEPPPAQTVIDYPQGWKDDEPRAFNSFETETLLKQLEARG